MRSHFFLSRGLCAATIGAAALFAVPAPAQDPNAGNLPPLPQDQQTQEGVEALTRGPVHEGYASPVVYNPQPGAVTPKAPPAAIEELPPDQKPEGDIVWIPGYWAWDEERQDYIWISGIWRDPPPGMTWVPGYWSEVQGGFQWTPGFWQQVQTQEVQYLPEPPQSLENGPNIPQPGDNYFWVPGSYVWSTERIRYMWQPGYWSGFQAGWVWVPSRYHWTPVGYVYTAGYWDVPLETRGVMFAPVYFTGVHRHYTPSIVLNVGAVTTHLFCRPHHAMYVFGDYYEDRYIRSGYTPWFEFNRTRYGYDPNFAYYNVYFHRTNPRWAVTLRSNYDLVRRDPSYRPPRTFVQQTNIVQNITNVNTTINNTMVNNVTINNISNNTVGRIGSVNMATPLNVAVKNNAFTNIKMARIDDNSRRQIQAASFKTRDVSQERQQLEHAQLQRLQTSGGAAGQARGGAAPIRQPVTLKLNNNMVSNLNAGASKVAVANNNQANAGAGTRTNAGNAGVGANTNTGANRGPGNRRIGEAGAAGQVGANTGAGQNNTGTMKGRTNPGVGTGAGVAGNTTGNNTGNTGVGAKGTGGLPSGNTGINPNAGIPPNIGNRGAGAGTAGNAGTGGATMPPNRGVGAGTGGGALPGTGGAPVRRPPPNPDANKGKDKKTTADDSDRNGNRINDDAARRAAQMQNPGNRGNEDNGRRGYPANTNQVNNDAAKQAQMAQQQKAAQDASQKAAQDRGAQAAQQRAAQEKQAQMSQQKAAQDRAAQSAQQRAAQEKQAQMSQQKAAQDQARKAQEQQAAKAARDAQENAKRQQAEQQRQQQIKQSQNQQGQGPQGGNQGNRPNRGPDREKEKEKDGRGR